MRIVVPLLRAGPGGPRTHVLFRSWGRRWGETAIIDNRRARAARSETASVAKAAPDGQTLIFPRRATTARPCSARARLTIRSAISPRSPTSACKATRSCRRGDSRSLVAELVAGTRARPSRLLELFLGGPRSSVTGDGLLCEPRGLGQVHIPFKSSQDATNDVLAGRSHAVIVPNVARFLSRRTPRLRILGVTSLKSARRSLPDAPPVSETVPAMSSIPGSACWHRARTPRAVIERINGEWRSCLRDPVISSASRARGRTAPSQPRGIRAADQGRLPGKARVVKTLGRIE